MQSHNGRQFEPDQDPYIRRWAARFNLAPDDRVVVMTATIEQLCSDLSEQFAALQHTVDERQEQWTHSLTTTNQTVQQALHLIHQQQTNQNSLTQTYAELTDSLLKFERVLTTLNAKISASKSTSPSLTSALTGIQATLDALSTRLSTVSSNQTVLDGKLNDLKRNRPTSNFNPWLWGAISTLIALNLVQMVGYKNWANNMVYQLEAIRGTVNSNLIHLKRLDPPEK